MCKNTRLFLFLVMGMFSCLGWANTQVVKKNVTNPSKAEYQMLDRLNETIKFYESIQDVAFPILSKGPALQIGMKNNEVKKLKQRLALTNDLPGTNDTHDNRFTPELQAAVASFQSRYGIVPDGIVGSETREALNVPLKKRIEQIKLNFTRWQELFAKLPASYVWINIPDYQLRFIKERETILTSKIIVGKITRATPEIDSKLNRITLNPYWYIPQGILTKDILPKVRNNPEFLAREHIRIFEAKNGKVELSVNEINWDEVAEDPSKYQFRQDPSDENALGQFKFEFDNPHLVYLHDTPKKDLFYAARRSFSSGCIRMEKPEELLIYLAKMDSGLNKELPIMEKALNSGETITFNLTNPLPIYITYITTWVDDNKQLHIVDDIYQRDNVELAA